MDMRQIGLLPQVFDRWKFFHLLKKKKREEKNFLGSRERGV
jgi:hypothetical protein